MSAFASRFPLRWVCYLAYFVGVSFQSGGIVHYSIDPSRYGLLIVIGAVVFLVGAVASDLIDEGSLLRRSGPLGFVQFIVSSLVLSIGVGMIGGSVQHFLDIPKKAPLLIGMGIVLSAIGFHGRFQPHDTKRELFIGVGLAVALALPVTAGLRSYASSIPAESDHHGSTAGEGAAHEESPAVRAPSTTFTGQRIVPTPVVATSEQSSNQPSTTMVATVTSTAPSDGHADHDHGG